VALGRVLVDSGRPGDAVPLLERAFELPDAPRDARLWLAHALAADGELERAQEQYRAVLARLGADDPLRSGAETGLGKATARLNATVVKKLRREADRQFRRKEWRAAEPVYARILALVPDDADASFRLGQAYARQNKLFAAYRRLTVFTREHPKHARMSVALKELDALKRYDRVNADDRETAKNAALAMNEGRFEEAADLYRKSLAWSPFYESAHRGRVKALLGLHGKTGTDGDLARAVEALDDLLFLVPEDDALLTTRARALLDLGELSRAARDAEAAAAGDSGAAEPVLLAGNARLKLGDLERAARHFEEAHRRTPSAEALYGLGLVHEQGGYMRNALRAFASALDGFDVDAVMRAKLMEAARRARAAIESESR
jgi:tetratricopeptide (TPR) repeat protein